MTDANARIIAPSGLVALICNSFAMGVFSILAGAEFVRGRWFMWVYVAVACLEAGAAFLQLRALPKISEGSPRVL